MIVVFDSRLPPTVWDTLSMVLRIGSGQILSVIFIYFVESLITLVFIMKLVGMRLVFFMRWDPVLWLSNPNGSKINKVNLTS